MLRTTIIVVAAILTFLGLVLVVSGVHMAGWQLLVSGAIVLVGTLFERWRYRQIEPPTNGRWQETDERFIDPSTGQAVEVMFDPRTGERRYVTPASGEGKDPRP
jgi:hypothetical protein